ncbi:hypothetical protein AA0111_g2582 [Alternaria arborescens]|uniref:hypothetical protein n=1 Tax=Alternaria arborescens TaxID=156630 RepID=UPI001074FD86|nr:hypothetical protein AA0111_g2582 [Alternaria arborescens]RYO37645.1 hypothetical protein AA0111_g2582 [Alternaria arborescens]
MKRYTAGKYIKSDDALYDVLHKKHKGISKADFEITRKGDLWSYKAPGKLTAEELLPAETHV